MTWNELTQFIASLEGGWKVLLHMSLWITGTAVVDFVQHRIVRQLRRKAERTENIWDDALLNALRSPLSALVWFLGLSFALRVVRLEYGWEALNYLPQLRQLGVIAILAWFLVRLVRRVEANVVQERLRKGEDVDRTTIDAIGKLLRILVIVIATLVAMQTMGFSIAGILAFGGVGGLAVGFAARDLLANFFGGLTIYLDRPFAVGEWIRTLDGAIEGTVEDIGWRSTKIRTFDRRVIYAPNSLFTTGAVENPSRMSHRRIREWIGLRYDDLDKIKTVTDAIRAFLARHPQLDQAESHIVNIDRFGPSSVDILVICYTPLTAAHEYQRVREDILLGIARIVAEHGAAFAYPTTTVHLASMPAPEGGRP